MNRIYQGRVTKLELLGSVKDEVLQEITKLEGEQLLWQHHELFQDAVNYYVVCLMAMAGDKESLVFKIRQRADGSDAEHAVWAPFTRKGQRRQGMREVAKYFGQDPESARLVDCCQKALEGNEASPELLDLALKELLFFCQGDGKIQQEGNSMFPRFCNADFEGGYNTGEGPALKSSGESRIKGELHGLTTKGQFEQFAREMQIAWLVNINVNGTPAKGEGARNRLLKSIAHFGQYFGTHKATTDRNERMEKFFGEHPDCKELILTIEEKIKALPVEELPDIPANRKSIPDRLEAGLLFKYFPSAEMAEILKVAFPPAKETVGKAADKETTNYASFGDDAIRLARGKRGFVFRAFTSLSGFSGSDTPEIEWKYFDILAFKEALKALNQIEQKGEERENERNRLQVDLKYMLGESQKYDESEESAQPPPVVAGDPRVQQLEKVLAGMRQAYDMTDEEVVEYGLHERTIRGFEGLRKDWNKLHIDNLSLEAAQKKLKATLSEYQTDNKETIGSAMLFEEFIQPDNWIIWKTPDPATAVMWEESKFGSNPLAALLQKRELENDIQRLTEPIRFTPADARYSRRQYLFGNQTTFKSKKGAYRHEINSLSVIVDLAVLEEGRWHKRRVRILYSAPRFLREGLRSGAEDLERMPWVQPMMEALGIRDELPQDMHSYAVFLMPHETREGGKTILLNFPVELNEGDLVERLGKRLRWAGQFAGGKDKNLYLRWPEDEWPKGWKGGRWYEKPEPFRVLSVDLGQRDAGAFALIACRPDAEFGQTAKGADRHSRYIGNAGGKPWHASVEKTGLLRLPGEDAQVLRNGQWVQELSGEKGRLATPSETEQAQATLVMLGCADKRLLEDEPLRRFFVTQNQKLLMALRWAQGRLARLHRWIWMLADEHRAATARVEILHPEAVSSDIGALAGEGKWELVAMRMEEEINLLKGVVEKSLVLVANRVLPLKGRKWEWHARQDGNGYVLRQGERGSDYSPTRIAGQRGLSMERIGQIEDLRKRCQSFNRAVMRKAGERAKMGRSARGIELPDPCPEILEKLERIREQRVDQTAHLILAEALGVRLKAHSKSEAERVARDIHGEYEKLREPVDFIVLEDLSRYLSSQGRSKGENSRLMKWCHRALLLKLKQLCETYGIPVLETAAAYSSRFSAKDGTPGFRAVEVGLNDKAQFRWTNALAKNEKEVVALFNLLEEINAGDVLKRRKLLAPVGGGPLFVPMRGPVEQADVNAATNLGLRAVAAPGRLDIHHRIRTERDSEGRVFPKTKSKREQARWGKNPPAFNLGDGAVIERNSNFFPLFQFDVAYERATLEGFSHFFASGKAVWGTIKADQWARIEQINRGRAAKNRWVQELPM